MKIAVSYMCMKCDSGERVQLPRLRGLRRIRCWYCGGRKLDVYNATRA